MLVVRPLSRYPEHSAQGDVWKRPNLSPHDRSILTVAALIAHNQTIEKAPPSCTGAQEKAPSVQALRDHHAPRVPRRPAQRLVHRGRRQGRLQRQSQPGSPRGRFATHQPSGTFAQDHNKSSKTSGDGGRAALSYDAAPNATRLKDDAAAENALPSAVDLVRTKLLDAGRNVEFGWLCFSVGDRQTFGLMANLTQRSASCGFVRPFAPHWPN